MVFVGGHNTNEAESLAGVRACAEKSLEGGAGKGVTLLVDLRADVLDVDRGNVGRPSVRLAGQKQPLVETGGNYPSLPKTSSQPTAVTTFSRSDSELTQPRKVYEKREFRLGRRSCPPEKDMFGFLRPTKGRCGRHTG